MRKFIKTFAALALTVAMLSGNGVAASAATQEVAGDSSSMTQSKDIEVTLEITSVYSVSLPASIELSPQQVIPASYTGVYYFADGVCFNSSMDVDGIFYVAPVNYGCAGKIRSNEYIFIEPVLPVTLTGDLTGATIGLTRIYTADSSSATEPAMKTQWDSSEVGSCYYDGVSISSCNYAEESIMLGFTEENLVSYENYTGVLTFNFGLGTN
jgi:hypothetical protein